MADTTDNRGRLFVIEGLDGSGKATQSRLLLERLRERGKAAEMLSFPCYDDDSSMLVRMYLAGEFGDKPGDVNGYAASVFYAADRYASYKKRWEKNYLAGEIFVADRYVTSNAVYQMSKLDFEVWDEYLKWLSDLEYSKLGIPRPDLVVYLDVPPEVGAALMAERYAGDETKLDIHERDVDYQQKSRRAALYCAGKEGWRIVDCTERGSMRSVEDISGEIMKLVESE